MRVVTTIAKVRQIRWADSTLTWGLVPTMGALHEGHLALVRQALAENDRVGVSIFVNPIQFNRRDDLEKYPRPLERDLDMLRAEGVHVVWTPDEAEMYPAGFQTYVSVENVTQVLEGTSRPGHFRGVATVVAKLFNVFEPTRAYFGQKDAQQVAVIRQMVRDLAFNLEVIACPTLRESDGLAMSSRNVRLNRVEREAAPVLYRALLVAQNEWQAGRRDAEHLRATIREIIEGEPLAKIDYVSVAGPISLQELEGPAERALLSLAVFLGEVRLIDNVAIG